MVERLDRLRHDTVVGRDHQDGDVGGLRTTGTHGGERLVTRGVDEGDAALVVVDVGGDLVGADVLGDATGLLVDHVGRTQRVEELGLSVVDVTHDGDDRRADHEVLLATLVLTELQVEGLEQLAVLVLGRDDLDDVVELLTEQLERLVVDRLGRGHHLAEVEKHLHELGGVDADLLGEVGQRGAARQPDGLAVALADAHAAQGRGLHGLELLATGPLRLATTTRGTAGATEGTLGLAALAGTTATGTTATGEAATAGPTSTGGAATTGGTTATGRAGTTAGTGATRGRTTAGTLAEGGRGLGHHRRVGTRHARATGSATVTRGRRPRGTLVAGAGTGTRGATGGRTRGGPLAHALAGGEGVVARARGAGAADRAGRRGLGGGRGSRCLGRGRLAGLGGCGLLGGSLGRGLLGGGGGRRLGGRRSLRAGLRTGLGTRGGGRLLSSRRLGGRLLGGRLVGRLGGGLGGRLRSGLGGRLLGGLLRGRGAGLLGLQLLAELLAEAHLGRQLDGRARRLDELTHLLELLENELALDSELLGELVNAGLGHNSPSGLETLVRGVPRDR